VVQNKPDYSTFQPSLRKFAQNNTINTCSAQTNKTKKKCVGLFKYSAVITILCDIIADVVDANVKTRPLTSDDRALICTLRVEKG